MSAALRNVARQESQRQGQFNEGTRMGRVTAYDPATYKAKVVILPEGDFTDQPGAGETGWIPIQTQWSGNGWGMYAPPTIGQRVAIEHVEGDTGSGIITSCMYDLQNVPLSVQSGEFWLVHKMGQTFKFTNDGKASLGSTSEVDIGNLGNTLNTLVNQLFEAVYNGHTHPVSGSVTSAPTQKMTSTHLTSVLKAN